MSARSNELLSRLAETVSRLNRVVSGGRTGKWNKRPEEGWSAHEILAHVRASNEILTPRVYQTLVRDNPPLPSFDERKWVEVCGYDQQSIDVLFERISSQTQELIHVLRRAPESAWQRSGNHEERGSITVEQLVVHLVAHEEEHIDEIDRLLKLSST
jgi:hypothetical protein